MTTFVQTREPVLSMQGDESASRAAISTGALRRPAAVVAVLAALGAVVLVPWIAYLGLTLPSSYTTTNWSGTWQGLDAALVVALAATALGTWRRWPSAALWAGAAGVLMLADAWFDLSLSTSGSDRVWSVVCACVEVPVALLVLRHGYRLMVESVRSPVPLGCAPGPLHRPICRTTAPNVRASRGAPRRVGSGR